jgi:hypothetical protein
MTQRNPEPTSILDYQSPAVSRFLDTIRSDDDSAIGFLRTAHAEVSRRIQPIYTVKERQSVSRTIERGQGSCSQRLACLEGLARSRHIATRVRALWLSGRFWHPRFPATRLFIPGRVLLAWPEFEIETRWCGIEDIYGSIEFRTSGAVPFGNDGETLFEAVRLTAVDFDGRTKTCSTVCDLSGFVLGRGETFDARDDLFDRYGSFEDSWGGKAFEMLYAGRAAVPISR